MNFSEVINDWTRKMDWNDTSAMIHNATEADVKRAIAKRANSLTGASLDVEDFAALISPAAAPYLEQMAQLSQRLTLKRFGKTLQLYIPLYLSNECTNECVYCGFSQANEIPRKTLSMDEIRTEAQVIRDWGFEHLLLVTGEAPGVVDMEYFVEALEVVKPMFAQLSFEVQPLDAQEYKTLADHGLYAVYVYQETYHKANYKQYHTKGKKSIFDYRVDTPDRLGEAGMHKIGLGSLLGLEDWRTDSFFTAMHLKHLEKKFWRTKFSVSFPRLRPHEGGDITGENGTHDPAHPMTNRELVQLITAWRIFSEDIEVSLSTRESPYFRDNVMPLGVTSVSAASSTEPGGYAVQRKELEQFSINDDRSHLEMQDAIRALGYEAVWKDWELIEA